MCRAKLIRMRQRAVLCGCTSSPWPKSRPGRRHQNRGYLVKVFCVIIGSAALLVLPACSSASHPAEDPGTSPIATASGPASLASTPADTSGGASPRAATTAAPVTITVVGDTMLGNTPDLPADPAKYSTRSNRPSTRAPRLSSAIWKARSRHQRPASAVPKAPPRAVSRSGIRLVTRVTSKRQASPSSTTPITTRSTSVPRVKPRPFGRSTRRAWPRPDCRAR